MPSGTAVPALLRQLESTAGAEQVDFLAVSPPRGRLRVARRPPPPPSGASPLPSPPLPLATPAAGAAAPASAAGATGGSSASAGTGSASYSLTFSGSFLNLERFLSSIHHFTAVDGPTLHVHGRLLSIQSVSLTTGTSGSGPMDASVIATVYTLPAGQSPAQLLAGVAPGLGTTAGAAPATAAQPISSTGRLQVVP